MASNINLVGRRRAPGITVNRVPAQPRIVGVSVSDGAMVGIAKKGPTDEALVISDYESFVDRYGDFYNNNYLAPAAKMFFEAGGGDLHVARIAASGSSVASTTLRAQDGLTASTVVIALDKGAGFLLELNTLKASSYLTSNVSSGSGTATIASINGFEVGDMVVFKDQDGSGTMTQVFVQSIAPSTKTLTFFAPSGAVDSFASGTSIAYVSTRHRARTTLSETYSGTTTLKVTSSAAMYQGQRLYVSDTVNHGTGVIKSVNGNTLILGAALGSNIAAANSFVVSMEFNVEVKEDGVLVENHEYLSLEDEAATPNNIDHVEVKLSGQNNDSIRITMTDSDPEDSLTAQSHLTGFESIVGIPISFADVALTGGNDGGTPTAAEWIGNDVSGSETGIYLFNSTKDIRFLAMPGHTTASSLRTMIDYCSSHETKGNCQAIIDPPSSDDTVDEVVAFRNVTLQRSTAFASLPWPWIHIGHPVQINSSFTMPPSPFYMGAASRVAIEDGIKQAPAGVEAGRLSASVKGIVRTISSSEHARLDEAGIIPVVFKNRYGYYFKGARTLSSVYNGYEWWPTQVLTNFISASLEDQAEPFVFKPNNEDTRDRLRAAVENFMESLHANGEFVPQNNPAEAFFVKCDSENNTQTIEDSGNLVCDVGFRAPVPAAFITFRIGRYNGVVTVVQTS